MGGAANLPALLGLAHLWVSCNARVALVLLLALGLGYPTCRRTVRWPAAPVFALLVGLALLSFVVCLLSWLRIFTGSVVIVVGVLAAAASGRCLVADLPGWRRRLAAAHRPDDTTIVCSLVLAVVLFGFSLFVLYPSSAFDATSYHLPLARDLVRHHGLVYDPFVRYSFFPQANEAIFAVMLLLTDNPVASAALEYWVLGLASVLLLLWFAGSGRRVGAGFVAAVLLLASPVTIYAGTTAFVDTWTLAFLLGGMLLALEAAEKRIRPVPALLLAGVMFGEAAATKYEGFGFAVLALLGALVAAGRSRAVWRALPAVLVGGLVVAAPWYAWTLHTTGDPAYPLLTSVFGNRRGLWTAAELKLQRSGEGAGGYASGVSAVLRQDLRYLRGQLSYDTGAHRSPLSWLLGLGVIGLLWPARWRDRTFLGAAVASVLSVVASLFASANPRYLVPATGFFALGAGLTADALLDRVPRTARSRLGHPLLVPAWCVLAAVIAVWTSFGFVHDVHKDYGNPPTSSAGIRAYLSARVDCYGAVDFLNRTVGGGYRAWGFNCEQARYYARGLLIGDAFSTGSRLRIFNHRGGAFPALARFTDAWHPCACSGRSCPRACSPSQARWRRADSFSS